MEQGTSSIEQTSELQRCAKCLYSLQGLPEEGNCPECGVGYVGKPLIIESGIAAWKWRAWNYVGMGFFGVVVVLAVVFIAKRGWDSETARQMLTLCAGVWGLSIGLSMRLYPWYLRLDETDMRIVCPASHMVGRCVFIGVPSVLLLTAVVYTAGLMNLLAFACALGAVGLAGLCLMLVNRNRRTQFLSVVRYIRAISRRCVTWQKLQLVTLTQERATAGKAWTIQAMEQPIDEGPNPPVIQYAVLLSEPQVQLVEQYIMFRAPQARVLLVPMIRQ
jgi:hypothetical protein